MKQILEIVEISAPERYIGKDQLGKSFNISTEKVLRTGQSVLLVNGVVVGVVQTKIEGVFNV